MTMNTFDAAASTWPYCGCSQCHSTIILPKDRIGAIQKTGRSNYRIDTKQGKGARLKQTPDATVRTYDSRYQNQEIAAH